MTQYMTKEEGQKKAREMFNAAKKEVMAHWSEWKEQTPAFINAYKNLEYAKRMCASYGVRI